MIGRLYYLKVVWGGVNFITKSHLEKIIFVDQSWIWPVTNFLIALRAMVSVGLKIGPHKSHDAHFF